MPNQSETPKLNSSNLVTIAYLKARLDEGGDHLGIFLPLVVDVIAQLEVSSFTTVEIQANVASIHGIAIPQQTVATLLKRLIKKGYLLRETGRYVRNLDHPIPLSRVALVKEQIQKEQHDLADALRLHAEKRGLKGLSIDATLDLLLRFLEEEQVGMLLGAPSGSPGTSDTSRRERTIIAEFVQNVAKVDNNLKSALRDMLDGLVLYQAAFLPDLEMSIRRFRNLRVIFDSNLVRQALGYEGDSMRTLARETIDVLKAGGARCIVLDTTLQEIKRILSMYETRLATEKGRNSLKPVPMARNFLTQRYSPSDVREMSALLESEIWAVGFELIQVPKHISKYTYGEKALAARLTDPATKDELEPRVVHDVDCVCAVLTFRRGHRSSNIDDAVAVFATYSPLVIRNVSDWWQVEEHETGIPPVVHIRALSNLAWLKKPLMSKNFKIVELVALCTAALRPNQATWNRFLRHLSSLQKSKKITSDEIASILVSALSDQLLTEVEVLENDPADIDAVTLDEVVHRVTSSYSAKAEAERQKLVDDYEVKFAELKEKERVAAEKAAIAEHTLSEQTRRRALSIDGRARKWAIFCAAVVKWILTFFVIGGSITLIFAHPFSHGWLNVVSGIAVAVFIALELFGILKHLSDMCASIESRLTKMFRHWLQAAEE